MAFLNLGLFHVEVAIIGANCEGFPILFSIDCNGFALVIALLLSLKFQLHEQSLSFEEKVSVVLVGDLNQTIGQPSISNEKGKHWLLKLGRFKVFDLNLFVMTTSTEVFTPSWLCIRSIQTPLTSRVKVEPYVSIINIAMTRTEAPLHRPSILQLPYVVAFLS
jgi:hypothetical protein